MDMNFSEVDNVLNEIKGGSFSFEKYVDNLMNGGSGGFGDIISNAASVLSMSFLDVRSLISDIIIIILMSAVFVTISRSFATKQVSDTGFYITYMLMYMLLATNFSGMYLIAENGLRLLIEFMTALLPSFFVSVTYVLGSSSSLVFYQSALILIAIVEGIILKIFLPMVNMYFIIGMLNPLLVEDYFSNALKLIEKIVMWGLKSIFVLVMGVGVVESIILPQTSEIRSVLMKRIMSVPGAGSQIGTAFEVVFGAGNIIKNSIGVAGLIFIMIICLYPAAKLLMYDFVCRLLAAAAQPVCVDKRMGGCLSQAARTIKMLFLIVSMSALLFLITIAVVLFSTNV